MVDSVGQSIAIQRALELELELEEYVDNDSRLRQQNQELSSRIVELETVLALGTGGVVAAPADSVTSSKDLSTLLGLWQQLGLSPEKRELILSDIRNANELAVGRFLGEARGDLQLAMNHRDTALETMSLVCKVFGLMQPEGVGAARGARSICESNKEIENLMTTLTLTADVKVNRLFEIKDRLLDLVSEMWLSSADLSMPLQTILKISKKNVDIATLAQDFESAGLVLTDSIMDAWSDEVSKLNVRRAGITTKAIVAKSAVVSFVRDLGLNESGLRNVSVGADVSSEAFEAAVTIVSVNSASNPPGSAIVLVALEQLQFGLESIKLHREQIAHNLSSFLQFISCYSDKDIDRPDPTTLYHQHILIGLFDLSHDSIMGLCDKESELTAKMVEYCKDIAGMASVLISGAPISLEYLLDNARKYSSDELFQPMTRAVESMDGLSVLLDEVWLKLGVKDFTNLWASKKADLTKVVCCISSH
jgi:hypothetical protein